MDFLKHIPKIAVNNNKLETWLANDLNVLLVGSHGVGKTSMILEVFKEKLGDKWAFYNGATTDPWTDLIGIPAINNSNGQETIKYIRPEDLNDDIEAIYVDELNRAKMATRNALLELIQFKSINGRKFPKLKVVWASINPPKDEEAEEEFIYDVEVLDPAQVDRFHIIVRLQEDPSLTYFSKKYDLVGRNLVEWWGKQSDVTKKLLTPRRLEYVAQVYKKGIDIADVLPVCANISFLKSIIDQDPISQKLNKHLLKNAVTNAFTNFLKKESHVEAAIPTIVEGKRWHLVAAFPKEIQAVLISKHEGEIYEYATKFKDMPILEQLLLCYKSNPDHTEKAKVITDLFSDSHQTNISETVSAAVPTKSQTEFLEIIKRGNSNILGYATYYRRKLVKQIGAEFPKELTNTELISELDKFLDLWSRRVQGYAIAQYVDLVAKKQLDVFDEELIKRHEEIGICIGIARALTGLDHYKYVKRGWYTKLTANSVQLLRANNTIISSIAEEDEAEFFYKDVLN